MPVGRPIGAKLFLEGQEVPFLGATFTHTVNMASIAYIDMVPHNSINIIKPRTHVVIAVRDYTNPAQNFPYVLAWEGEVFGFSFGRTTSSRTFTIQCVDLTGYWDNVLTYFFNLMHSLGKGGAKQYTKVASEQRAAKGANAKIQDTSHGTTSYFRTVFEDTFNKDANADFLDAFVAVYSNLSDVNPFYELAELRFRIKERIGLHSSKFLTTLIGRTDSLNWIEQVAGRTSGFQSLRSVIQDLMSLVFHDYLTVPFPGRIEGDALTGKPLRARKKENKTIGHFIFKPNLYMIPAPACNIFFPDEYSNFQYSRNYFKEPTRMNYRPELPHFLGAGQVVLPHVFQPDSYDDFMLKKDGSANTKGVDATDTDGKQGGQEDPEENDPKTKQKKEYKFLTNEERVKGIFMAFERMVPAVTQFSTVFGELGKRDFTSKIAKYLFFKKRFQERNLQITSHLKLSVVPGFPVLILDDSDADHNVQAYMSSATHRVYATEGGHTNVTLSYARTITEVDVASNRGSDPPVPPWYDPKIFGEVTTPPESPAAKKEVAQRGAQHVTPARLADFYKALLGDKGSAALTTLFKNEVTVVGATRELLAQYALAQEQGSDAVQNFIARTTARDYIRIRDSFDFIGASTKTFDLREDNFIQFTGKTYEGVGVLAKDGSTLEELIKDKKAIIQNYRNALIRNRGFRG